MKSKHTIIKTIAYALVVGICLGASYGGIQAIQNVRDRDHSSMLSKKPQSEDDELSGTYSQNTESEEGTLTASATPVPTSSKDVSGVVDNVMPALVSIQGRFTQVYYDFFGRGYEKEVSGSGSGIIMAQNGEELLIVTNYHVVEDALSLQVMFLDGTIEDATIKGTEKEDDLAVISVSLKNLSESTLNTIKIASLGDSENLKLGEMVIAIGNALGYGQSTTVGYVSALNRDLTMNDGTELTLIQTDVAINPGNSGGALLNAKGQVIGINNAKIADTDVEGICYAIPISSAIPVINDIINRELLSESEMAYVGVRGQTVTESDAKALNMPTGYYILEVEEGSPADQAGIKIGCIITAINDKTVASYDDFTKILSYTRGGTEGTITVKVMKEGTYVEEVYPIAFGFRTK